MLDLPLPKDCLSNMWITWTIQFAGGHLEGWVSGPSTTQKQGAMQHEVNQPNAIMTGFTTSLVGGFLQAKLTHPWRRTKALHDHVRSHDLRFAGAPAVPWLVRGTPRGTRNERRLWVSVTSYGFVQSEWWYWSSKLPFEVVHHWWTITLVDKWHRSGTITDSIEYSLPPWLRILRDSTWHRKYTVWIIPPLLMVRFVITRMAMFQSWITKG